MYLVAGANLGLGLGLITELAARDDIVVFAGARIPAEANALKALQAKYPGRLHAIKLTSADKVDNEADEAAIATINKVAGRLDVVIANAGVAGGYSPSLEVPKDDAWETFEVNALGRLVLFQAAYPLLRLAPKLRSSSSSSLPGWAASR